MSTLLWTSPRSSPGPAGAAGSASAASASSLLDMPHPYHHQHPHHSHQVSFGQAASPFSQLRAGSQSWTGSGGPSGQAAVSRSTASGSANSFGFGFGYTSPSNVTPYGGVASTSAFPFPSSSTVRSSNSYTSTSQLNSSPTKRRKRRSESPSDNGYMQEDGANEPNDDERLQSGKRVRRVLRPLKGQVGTSAAGHLSASPPPSSEVDVGKVLASLSKPALLGILHSLLSQQPDLKAVITSLLPAPSIEAFTGALAVAERKVLDALPVGSNLRDEYVWSRIRTPLEEYVAEARAALSQFCIPISAGSTSTFPSGDEASAAIHPATTFNFLFELTQSVRKLEVILPRAPLPFGSSYATNATCISSSPQPSINNPSTLNPRDPLISFLPPLFNQWHVLATRLSTLVNQNGHVLSADTVRQWFRQLDALVQGSGGSHGHVSHSDNTTSIGRRASEAVRERFVRELGWLIGLRSTVIGTAQAAAPVIQSVANQLQDSKMMMGTEDDNSDEEL